MKPSRPVVMAIVGGVLVAAVFLYTRSLGTGEDIPPLQQPGVAQQAAGGSTTAEKTSTTTDLIDTNRQSETAASEQTKSVSKTDGLPAAVDRALSQRKIVVLIFWDSKSVDAQSTKATLKQLRAGVSAKNVVVIDQPPRAVNDYVNLIGVPSQIPAVAVIGLDGKFQLREGYIDYTSILQIVNDVARLK